MTRSPLSSSPVFIGGEGRSGTTLLALMLDAHPQLAVGPELHFRGPGDLGPTILSLLQHREQGNAVKWETFRHDPAHSAGFHFINRCHRCGIEPSRLRTLIGEVLPDAPDDITEFSSRCRLVEAIGRDMMRAKGASIWGIKIMRDIRVLDWYFAMWPGARFVHIVRDGRDVAASQMRDHTGWGYDDARQAAERWADTVARVHGLAEGAPVHELRYEDLVGQPEPTMRQLLAFLGVDWNPSVLRHERAEHALFRNPHRHPSEHTVRKPLNDEAVGRWRRDLSPAELTAWMTVGAQALEQMGYET